MTDARHLSPTPTIDFDHPAVLAYAHRAAGDAADPRERAIRLHRAVRDDIVYDPYGLGLDVAGMPLAEILAAFRDSYPTMFPEAGAARIDGDFAAEGAAERGTARGSDDAG